MFTDKATIYIKAGMLLTAASGIILENASMCYTDTLTGALLLAGICYIINGFFDTWGQPRFIELLHNRNSLDFQDGTCR